MYKQESLLRVKNEVQKFIGSKVLLNAKGGRRKPFVKEGILEEAYGSVFTVRLSEKSRVSFNYADILTKAVELTVYE